jgi:hypothetical protein
MASASPVRSSVAAREVVLFLIACFDSAGV